MQPHRSYLICGTPRSGSSLLCEALGNSGVAGRPAEYFWKGDEQTWAETWGLSNYTYGDYLQAALWHGTTPNGLFGAKVMWGYVNDFARRLRQIPGYESPDLPDLLGSAFPDLRYIWITRRDKVRQAISHWKAIQTEIWGLAEGEAPPPAREPVYDFDAIDRLVQDLRNDDAAWNRYFDDNHIRPFMAVYEEFVDRYEETILEALRFLGVPPPADLGVAKRRVRKQADAVSDAWAERYFMPVR